MPSEPMHLAERAAQRLRASGAPAMGGLLGEASAPPPGLGAPDTDAPPGEAPGQGVPGQGAPGQGVPGQGSRGQGPRGQDWAVGRTSPRPPIGIPLLMRAGMIEWGRKRSRISEEFRIIQGQVLRTHAGIADGGVPGANLVMITSARPSEGKSFTALNLGCAIASYGETPVLLLDADAKHNSISALLGLSAETGLLDLASDPKLDSASLVVRTDVPFFSVLPIGAGGANKEELSASLPLANTVARLGREFPGHVVVLDAPPCMVSSDPSTLAPVVGQVILLIEAQRTQRGEIDAAVEMVGTCETVSLVLNKIRSRAGDTFGADGYYGSYYKS